LTTAVEQVAGTEARTDPLDRRAIGHLLAHGGQCEGFDSPFSHRSPAMRTGERAQRTTHNRVRIRHGEGGYGVLHCCFGAAGGIAGLSTARPNGSKAGAGCCLMPEELNSPAIADFPAEFADRVRPGPVNRRREPRDDI
jgi:hypothetical protein